MANTRTFSIDVMLEARILQAARADDRTRSKIVQILIEQALPGWWKVKGLVEPIIADPVEFIRLNSEVKE